MNFQEGFKLELNTVTDFVQRVYPGSAPEGTPTPYAVYHRSSSKESISLNSLNGPKSETYQVDIFDKRLENVISLSNAVVGIIKGCWERNIGGSGPYIQAIKIINQFEIFESTVKQYHGVIEFTVFY